MDAPAVAFPSPAFDALLVDLRTLVERGGSRRMLLVGQGDARHLALGRLAEALHVPFVMVPLDVLFDERPGTMRASVREAFDAAGTVPAILCFDYVGATHARVGEAQNGEMTPIDYLFERARSYRGLVVACVRDPARADALADRADVRVEVTGASVRVELIDRAAAER